MVFRKRYKTKKSRNTIEFFSLKVIISSIFHNSILEGIKNICGTNCIYIKRHWAIELLLASESLHIFTVQPMQNPIFLLLKKNCNGIFFYIAITMTVFAICNLQFARIKNPEITTSFDWFFFSSKLFIYAIITVWKIAISDRIFCHNKKESSTHWYGATNSTLRRRLLHKRVS